MRIAGVVAGLLVAAIGIIWTLQGLGSEFAPQSFMTDSGTWIVIGLVTCVSGVTLAAWSWRRST